jgi:hypothetical protein
MDRIYKGNAVLDGTDTRGWIIGHFMPEGDLRKNKDVEIKWGQRKAGEERDKWVKSEHRTTVCILVSGKVVLEFSDRDPVTLQSSGDYVMWGPGVLHSRYAIEDSTTITIRWPSLSVAP